MNEEKENFLKYLKFEKRYSQLTISSYKREIENFIDYLKQEDVESLEEVDDVIVRGYVMSLSKKELSHTTINHYLSSLRSFFKYLLRHQVVKENPFALVSSLKQNIRNPDFLYEDEMMGLLDSIETDTLLGVRNKALLELMYASGLRCSEVVNLTLSHIDFDEQMLNIACYIKSINGSKISIMKAYNYICELDAVSFTNFGNYMADIDFGVKPYFEVPCDCTNKVIVPLSLSPEYFMPKITNK